MLFGVDWLLAPKAVTDVAIAATTVPAIYIVGLDSSFLAVPFTHYSRVHLAALSLKHGFQQHVEISKPV